MSDLDADGLLTTDTGVKVARLDVKPPLFVDRTVAIYGPSGTGKTVIMKNIMRVVSPHIEQVLVIAPTEPTNRSYEGFVDPTLIHYRMWAAPKPGELKGKDTEAKGTQRFLENIWDRQEMMAATYKRANNPAVLSQLFGRLPRAVRDRGHEHINAINSRREEILQRIYRQFKYDPGLLESKAKEINKKFKDMLSLIYKKFIIPNYADLHSAGDLSEDEKFSLRYVEFNPRLLLIFDDCAAQLKPMFKLDIMRKLFYQNRHSFITVIFGLQDDTDLAANLRKNAFVSFFTEPIVCRSNFDRGANQFPKAVKTYVEKISTSVFRGNRKLAYIREDPAKLHFYHVEFPMPVPEMFGSPALQELCNEVHATGASMDTKNPYYNLFTVDN
jgi:ABC-type dipeptide/oligopeptide/nickel transport system ATPase component